MADEILQPTNNDSPDGGQGGTSAVSSPSNTGHAETTASASGDTTDSRSCLWTDFEAAGATPSVLTLTFDWVADGTIDILFGTTNALTIDYSTNGGSNWTNAVTLAALSGSQNDSESINIANTVSVGDVQVRNTFSATGVEDPGEGSKSASIAVTVSNIQLEISYGGNRIITGMM